MMMMMMIKQAYKGYHNALCIRTYVTGPEKVSFT